jgi:hypothetical protein
MTLPKMNSYKSPVRILAACFVGLILLAPGVAYASGRNQNPFGAQDAAIKFSKGKSSSELHQEIERQISGASTADQFCYLAELMKRNGDYRASQYYEKAIRAEPDEPAYELFYGEYLRNFRGPLRPLFPGAEKHLLQAKAKLQRLKNGPSEEKRLWDAEVENRLTRALVALYERDGIPVPTFGSDRVDNSQKVSPPLLFFSSGVRAAQSDADLDRTSDVRDYTAAAAFSQSSNRLRVPLAHDQLRGLVRLETPLENVNRLRFRYKEAPSIDVFFNDRHTGNAAITNYYQPDGFNRLELTEYGIAAEKPFTIDNQVDCYIGGSFRRTKRTGLIEFLPDAHEDIYQTVVEGAISRFIGPDKVNADFVYVHQGISPRATGYTVRDRDLYGGTFSYQVYRPIPTLGRDANSSYAKRFETRGIDMFFGVLHDLENFNGTEGNVPIQRRDYFVGISAKGIGPSGRFDATIQPTWFNSNVLTDATQFNSQYRTAANLLYRIVDEERTPGVPGGKWLGTHLAFLNLVIPFKHDIATNGLDAFENYRIGVSLTAKWFSTGLHGVSFLGSIGWDFQRFYRLDKNQNLWNAQLSIGF